MAGPPHGAPEEQWLGDVAAELNVIASSLAERMRVALADAGVDFPVATLAVWQSDSGEEMFAEVISAGSASNRVDAARLDGPRERFWRAWDPHEFAMPASDLPPPSDSGIRRAQEHLVDKARLRGIEDPGHWALRAVLQRITANPPFAVADHFVVYAFDDEFGDDLADNIRRTCTPDTIAYLQEQGLLPADAA
jgi:hypothetical protein